MGKMIPTDADFAEAKAQLNKATTLLESQQGEYNRLFTDLSKVYNGQEYDVTVPYHGKLNDGLTSLQDMLTDINKALEVARQNFENMRQAIRSTWSH